VVPVGWELPDFVPGQFAVLGLPVSARRIRFSEQDEDTEPPSQDRLIRRAYSIASSSRAKEYLEFYISLVRTGELTPRVFALKVGDGIWLSKRASGLFTLEEVPLDQNIVMVATSTGIAPYMSMLRSQFERTESRRYAVLHGARSSWDLGYHGELITMSRLCGNLAYIPLVSRPDLEPAPWSGMSGYVQDVWKSGQLERLWGVSPVPSNTHLFLCGNPNMIDGMAALLQQDGYRLHKKNEPGQIHMETYW
jgi:ferredoxin--NADP+ reductase